jgi:hypothetical protein
MSHSKYISYLCNVLSVEACDVTNYTKERYLHTSQFINKTQNNKHINNIDEWDIPYTGCRPTYNTKHNTLHIARQPGFSWLVFTYRNRILIPRPKRNLKYTRRNLQAEYLKPCGISPSGGGYMESGKGEGNQLQHVRTLPVLESSGTIFCALARGF